MKKTKESTRVFAIFAADLTIITLTITIYHIKINYLIFSSCNKTMLSLQRASWVLWS